MSRLVRTRESQQATGEEILTTYERRPFCEDKPSDSDGQGTESSHTVGLWSRDPHRSPKSRQLTSGPTEPIM